MMTSVLVDSDVCERGFASLLDIYTCDEACYNKNIMQALPNQQLIRSVVD